MSESVSHDSEGQGYLKKCYTFQNKEGTSEDIISVQSVIYDVETTKCVCVYFLEASYLFN